MFYLQFNNNKKNLIQHQYLSEYAVLGGEGII